MASAGVEKLKLGVERLHKAGHDADMLGAALTSIHGALEDRFRHLLALTPELSASEHTRVLDVTRVHWAELIDLMRLHRNLSAEDATFIRTMNHERQEIAHGGRFRGRRAAIERYATLVQSFFPEFDQQTVVNIAIQQPLPIPPAGKPAKKSQSASERKRPTTKTNEPQPRSKPTASKPNTKPQPPEVKPRARSRSTAVGPVKLNPGLVLTLVLLLLLFCAGGSQLIQSQQQQNPAATTPIIAPLPAVSNGLQRITTADLNLRVAPGLGSEILQRMPAGTTVDLLVTGPEADGHRWVQIRYGTQEGWVDEAFLREP
jgi:hypothetical protein